MPYFTNSLQTQGRLDLQDSIILELNGTQDFQHTHTQTGPLGGIQPRWKARRIGRLSYVLNSSRADVSYPQFRRRHRYAGSDAGWSAREPDIGAYLARSKFALKLCMAVLNIDHTTHGSIEQVEMCSPRVLPCGHAVLPRSRSIKIISQCYAYKALFNCNSSLVHSCASGPALLKLIIEDAKSVYYPDFRHRSLRCIRARSALTASILA